MLADTPNIDIHSLPAARLARNLARRYGLRGPARVLVIGSRAGEIVSCFRSAGVMAFGLYDGPAPPRDPYAQSAEQQVVPELQPAVLHQSVPFLAQSFECVLLMDSDVYGGPLRSPETCTATANLLASLKPGRTLVYGGPLTPTAFVDHLAVFPGRSREITLGAGGIAGLLGRLLGKRGASGVEFIIPDEAISRLAWHRLARQAVMASQRQPAA